ncbi:MAG: hypothetical protein QM723_07080 [Myxococcaceae bacterium]
MNFRWVGPKEAAAVAEVHEKTVRRWCLRGLVKAYRLACGTGPWRIAITNDGRVCDPAPRA